MPNKRKDIDNKFYSVNAPLFYWYIDPLTSLNVHSSAMKFNWIEEDYFVNGNGKDITISASLPIAIKVFGLIISVTPTLALTWHINNDDEDCGGNIVQFQDPITHPYTTGPVEWVEKN